MKLAIISDTHGRHRQVSVPKCDILIHAGDWTDHNSNAELPDFLDWLSEQPANRIIMIHGNHDNPRKWDPAQLKFLPHLTVLHDSSVTFDGIKFYGSPYTPEFFNWHWMLPRNGKELEEKWAQIPDDTSVLITHGPPHGTLDFFGKEHVGCELLAARVRQLKELQLHCFGHIHSCYGQTHNGKYVNASQVDERYAVAYKPIVVELPYEPIQSKKAPAD